MKVIIFGSRHMPFSLYPLVGQAIEKSGFDVTEVVCGMARGADTWGAKWAYDNKIPIRKFPANWEEHGKRAGPIRNKEMGDYADAGIGFIWPGSRGSEHMRNYLEHLGKPHFIVYNGELDYAF
jgi:hypothetical protein